MFRGGIETLQDRGFPTKGSTLRVQLRYGKMEDSIGWQEVWKLDRGHVWEGYLQVLRWKSTEGLVE